MLENGNIFCTEDGVHLYYTVTGTGEPVIFLHGWTQSHKAFARNIPAVAKSYQVIAPDYRGHGYSEKTLSGHTLEQYAKDLHQLTVHLKLPQFSVVAWSLSVNILMKYVEMYSDAALKSIVLVDGAHFPFSAEAWNVHPMAGYNVAYLAGKLQQVCIDPIQASKDWSAAWFKDKEKFAEDIKGFAADFLNTPPAIACALYSNYSFDDSTPGLRKLTKPVLIFSTAGKAPRAQNQQSHIQSDCQVVYMDAGHAMFWENAEEFNEALLTFLQKH